MSKYKFRNFYKILLYYYFLNAIKVYKCQMSDDVEFVIPPKVEKNDVSEVPNHTDESEYYEPYKPIEPQFNFDDDIDESKKVNLNVNNNLHEAENVPRTQGEQYTEINELQISGEKTLLLSESPYILRQDLEVLQNARLIIQPGVQVNFVPMVGITVHGQLRAIVSSTTMFIFLSYLISKAICGNKCSYPNTNTTRAPCAKHIHAF